MGIPTAKLGSYEISRLIIGGNPFSGGSHFSEAKNRWLIRLLTHDKNVEMLEKCREEGINTFLGRIRSHNHEAIDISRKRNIKQISI